MGERRGTKGLELWCRKMTEGYPGVKIENMTTSWRNGLAFCAIIHHFRPDLIDFSKLNKDDVYYNNELAFTIAERHLGIPALLEPEDMVELNVPDRLSILTYLSQFYQAFVVSQGSPSRILPKRPAPTSERGIVSPASTSPPTKMTIHCGIARREPCAKCGLPVFIAERLNVGKQLYHRTCFRCARCNSQLTLANYYETENNEFCCEMCPDEEPVVDLEKSVLNRSLSDEEKSAGLKKYEETDNYSAIFETALEAPENENLLKNYTLSRETSDEFSAARSNFMKSQISLHDSGESTDEEPPELPKSKPPDINKSSENMSELCNVQDIISEDSGFPNNKLVNSVSDSVSNQHKTASTELEKTHNFVTKETNQTDDSTNSLVKARMLLFEKSPSEDLEECEKAEPNKISPKIEEETPSEEIIEDTKLSNENISCTAKISEEAIIIISDESIAESKILDKSVITISDSSRSLVETPNKRHEDYPEDLNPFGDESEEEPLQTNLKKSRSLNPFDDDEFEAGEEDHPKPAVRRKIKANLKTEQTNDTPEHLKNVYVQRISMGHMEDDLKKPQPVNRKQASTTKIISAPKISLNPFWSDGEEPPDEEIDEKPKPLPRYTKTSAEIPEPKPRESGLSISSSTNFGSNASISSATSTPGQTIKKKKPAPKPPVNKELQETESPLCSLNTSPNHSLLHSPKSTPKLRKHKKAPPPPSFASSTPFIYKDSADAKRFIDLQQTDIKPISLSDDNWENEKTAKDEVNRNRQSQHLSSGISPTSSENSSSLSAPNKSTYGKWKRRKGPAPSRPVPQRRTVKALSILEIRRELDVIEIQQQGLEKQGVRLEQIIRERCEGPNANEDVSLSPDIEDMVLQLFDLVNEKNELFRKQAELMYLRRQHRLEEEHADVEYQIRCLIMQPDASKTDSDKAREEELINRLVEIVERRNEIIECLEMDRVREAEEDDSIKDQLNKYSLKRDEEKSNSFTLKKFKKDKKKHKKEKRFKLKGHKVDIDKDVDECESSNSESPVKEKDKKKKKFNIF